MTITTFCLAGYTGRPLDRDHLGGELFRGQFQRRDVSYDNRWFGTANFNDGRAKAKAALIGSKGNVVALGQSLGARILGSLLDDAEVLAACPPSRCAFVLTGHPDRKHGGASTVQYSGIMEGYGYTGVPDDCQYRVWDCARQYGMAEDHPDDRSNRAAVSNLSSAVHSDYRNVYLGDPANVKWVDPENPNVTYVLSVTYPLPSIESKWWGLQRKAEEDAKQRPEVEKGYTRPVPVPTPTVNRMFNSTLGYDGATRRFVRMPSPAPWNPFQ